MPKGFSIMTYNPLRPIIQEPKSPSTPLFQMGELNEIPLKISVLKKGIWGDSKKTTVQKEILASAIVPR
jgi:hypothetical protein